MKLNLMYEGHKDSDSNEDILQQWAFSDIPSAKFPLTATSEGDCVLYDTEDMERLYMFLGKALGFKPISTQETGVKNA